ncbi:hypothetical protein J6590_005983 [Homalodisca vitripennis]|nr:hypothetical protein J6590_005983 [Homalodisca vitripennis]
MVFVANLLRVSCLRKDAADCGVQNSMLERKGGQKVSAKKSREKNGKCITINKRTLEKTLKKRCLPTASATVAHYSGEQKKKKRSNGKQNISLPSRPGLELLAELKDAIKTKVAAIDQELLERVHADFLKRLETCIQENGHHLFDVICHK